MDLLSLDAPEHENVALKRACVAGHPLTTVDAAAAAGDVIDFIETPDATRRVCTALCVCVAGVGGVVRITIGVKCHRGHINCVTR